MQVKGCQKGSCNSVTKKRNYSWLPAVIVAVLPKCPFCVMAYSGAVTMCSGMKYPNIGSWNAYFSLGLAAFVLLSILLNRRGLRTWIALAITSLGILLLFTSQFMIISMSNYYLGVTLLFFGIWYNGSFIYFFKRFFLTFKKYITITNYDSGKL